MQWMTWRRMDYELTGKDEPLVYEGHTMDDPEFESTSVGLNRLALRAWGGGVSMKDGGRWGRDTATLRYCWVGAFVLALPSTMIPLLNGLDEGRRQGGWKLNHPIIFALSSFVPFVCLVPIFSWTLEGILFVWLRLTRLKQLTTS
eukprot:gene13121-54955_t